MGVAQYIKIPPGKLAETFPNVLKIKNPTQLLKGREKGKEKREQKVGEGQQGRLLWCLCHPDKQNSNQGKTKKALTGKAITENSIFAVQKEKL